MEISKALKSHPELHLRMGIHSEPVNEVTDLNEQANIAGAGINVAQRIMACGDAGHVLLSRHVAEDLEQYPRWRTYLHELGECEVKHGARVGVVNFYGDEVGNPQLPKKFQALKAHRARAHLLLRCSGSIPCSIRSGMIRASKNSAKKNQSELNAAEFSSDVKFEQLGSF